MERNRMKALSLKRARLTARATAAKSEKPSDAKATERSVSSYIMNQHLISANVLQLQLPCCQSKLW